MDQECYADQTVYFKSSEKMKEILSEGVDVIVTSPPYNRGKNYTSDDARGHNDALPERKYHALLRRVFRECHRVLSDDGVFFLNIGDAAADQGKSMKVADQARRAGFHLMQTIVWVKSLMGRGHYTPSGGRRRLNNLWEYVFVLVKDRRKYRYDTKAIGIPYTDKSNIGRYSKDDCRDPGNVWLIPYEKTTGKTVKKGHDAPFPVELARRCIKLVPGAEIVLDPFLGSGVTLAACRDMGLKGFGYELYPRKSLIEETILGAPQSQKEQCLLPHLEKTVALLAAALEQCSELPNVLTKLGRTQRGRGDRDMLCQVMKALGVGGSLRESLVGQAVFAGSQGLS